MIDLERLEELPTRLSMTRHLDFKRHYGKGCDKKINGYYASTHAQRIIEKYHGKNVNAAFSEYCKIVSNYRQNDFWDLFGYDHCWRFRRRKEVGHWFVDEDKNIQFYNPNKKKSPAVSVYSYDYRIGTIHIGTGKEFVHDGSLGSNFYFKYHSDKLMDGIVSGEKRFFPFKGHKYKRYVAEQLAIVKKIEREIEPKKYSFEDNPLRDENRKWRRPDSR